MDRLWILKFMPMIPVPGNEINIFFDSEAKARKVFDEHASLLTRKLEDEMPTLIFDDLLGRQCLRSSFFPRCMMAEVGPSEIAWMEIKKKCDAAQREAGIVQDVGFKSDRAEEIK